jgi:hypothetical protein
VAVGENPKPETRNPKPPFGGNVGRKAVELPAGIKPGSPEHEQWKRDKEAKRKRDERAAQKSVTPPPPLPPSTAPLPETVALSVAAPGGPVAGDDGVASLDWLAADFNGCAPEVIELLEAGIIESNSKLASEGGLPEKVVRKIAADSAFPKSSKESLRRTSPEMLAKFANTVRLPVTLKPYISGLPSVAVILLGQFRLRGEIRRLIEEDKSFKAQSAKEPAKN